MDLVELVPNVSEGRSEPAITEIANALADGPGVWLLDVHRDASLNRAVITAVGRPEAVCAAAARLVDHAIRLIDMRRHRGEHPRIGAVDVLPLVPLGGVSREQAVELARRLAGEISRTFSLPVFLYGHAARDPKKRDLPPLRRGGFEALERRMAASELKADCGPNRPHPTAGATAVGVRDFLIAYNVELDTSDRSVAEEIARRIRSSTGGLPDLRALGFERTAPGLPSRVLVSMNLLDFRTTPLASAFDAVSREASRLGVEVAGSEIVGLIPQGAAFPGMVERLKLGSPPGVLEERIRERGPGHLAPPIT